MSARTAGQDQSANKSGSVGRGRLDDARSWRLSLASASAAFGRAPQHLAAKDGARVVRCPHSIMLEGRMRV